MATTTNYSFPTPDDTDLVKDGASAIRSFGTAVDTQIKDLSPGTTAGDVDYYTTSTAKARLGIGTAGQVLSVNSGATAPEWTTISSGGLTLLSTTSLTGIATTVSSISSAYTNLLVFIQNPHVNVATTLRIFPNSLAFTTFHTGTNGTTTVNSQLLTTESSLLTSSNAAASGYCYILYNYADASYAKPFQFFGTPSTTVTHAINVGGLVHTTGAINALKFDTGNGTSTFSGGQVLIYGVK